MEHASACNHLRTAGAELLTIQAELGDLCKMAGLAVTPRASASAGKVIMRIKQLPPALLVGVALVARASVAQAQDVQARQIIDEGIMLLKSGCQIGIRESKTQAGFELNIEATLRRLFSAGARAGAGTSRRDAEGLVSAFEQQITKEGAELSREQLACTRSFAEKIYNDLRSLRRNGGSRSPAERFAPTPPPTLPAVTTAVSAAYTGWSSVNAGPQRVFLTVVFAYQTNAATGEATGPCAVSIVQHSYVYPNGTLDCNFNIASATFIASGNITVPDTASGQTTNNYVTMNGYVDRAKMTGNLSIDHMTPLVFVLDRTND